MMAGKKEIKKIISALPAVLVALLFVAVFVYAWTEPSVQPPNSDPNVAIPLNNGSLYQYKKGNLALNTDGAYAYGLLVPNGNVGIGTASPGAKLEVSRRY